MPTQRIPCSEILNLSYELCRHFDHEFVTPEHTLMILLGTPDFQDAIHMMGGRVSSISDALYIKFSSFDKAPPELSGDVIESIQFHEMVQNLYAYISTDKILQHENVALVHSILTLKDSWASTTLQNEIGGSDKISEFLSRYANLLEKSGESSSMEIYSADTSSGLSSPSYTEGVPSILTLMNDKLEGRDPLIGREKELERTIEVLCRKSKNNPLHIGEPGVGKTALVWGLVEKIVKGDVPERLKGINVYMLDLGSLLASSQYRGEMEKNLRDAMSSIDSNISAIIYIDDIHTLVGAGRTGDSALDATDLLKPYMDDSRFRFIGSTTYDDFKRYIERNRGMVRRFQVIDIPEPSIESSIEILSKLKSSYESFHNVHYPDDVIRFAVEGSSKYIRDRFLPDKALDLIDEAGARMEIHPTKKREIGMDLVSSILSSISKIDTIKTDMSTTAMIESLDKRILKRIYGQDEAVGKVVEAIQMSKAGLSDEGKPLASLLFVGPTGVGKTEVARVLSDEMGIELLRFDMSEYTEKHTVAKLIGSPSGYVGYDDGGLLTDAIRKNPNCVLLLDEIEKAHSDIYNLLLQVMDYANLTDNKGKKADFRNVVLIMTSNAGAQYASQASVGFSGGISRGEAMQSQVKKLFKPEFINRLTSIVTFNDMDEIMARQILKKKLSELSNRLKSRKVEMHLSDGAFDMLLHEGFSKEYGAREMDRVIGSRLKPILMREILFGKLKEGGKAQVVKVKKELMIKS